MLSTGAYNPVEMRVRDFSAPLVAVSCTLMVTACGSSDKLTTTSDRPSFASFLRFSECMRAHGLPDFPDPSAGGGIHLAIAPGSGIDPRSPAFQSAQRSCKHLLPGGGPRGRISESQKITLIKHAECMRANGVPGYPDPRFPPGGGIETFIGPDANAGSPAFQHAMKACGGP